MFGLVGGVKNQLGLVDTARSRLSEVCNVLVVGLMGFSSFWKSVDTALIPRIPKVVKKIELWVFTILFRNMDLLCSLR